VSCQPQLRGSVLSLQKVGDSLIDSVIGENIPILTEQEKFNETITSSVKRLESSLTGKSNNYNIPVWAIMPFA